VVKSISPQPKRRSRFPTRLSNSQEHRRGFFCSDRNHNVAHARPRTFIYTRRHHADGLAWKIQGPTDNHQKRKGIVHDQLAPWPGPSATAPGRTCDQRRPIASNQRSTWLAIAQATAKKNLWPATCLLTPLDTPPYERHSPALNVL